MLLGLSPSTASPPRPDGCWQPAYVGLGAEKALGAAALGISSRERMGWGHCHPSKD